VAARGFGREEDTSDSSVDGAGANRFDRSAFLNAPGTAARCIREVDWSRTSLGPVETWPVSLRTTIGMMLRSRHAMFLWWGPDLLQFYNDAYLPSFGVGIQPTAMGQRGRECWEEVWPIIGPQIELVMSSGQSTWNEDQLLPVQRNGRLEEIYWTYGYSPVFDEVGGVGGTFVVCTETTARVIAERRLRASRLLTERMSVADDPTALLRTAVTTFGAMTRDVPFAITFLYEPDGLRLIASIGLSEKELETWVPLLVGRLQNVPRRAESERRRGGGVLPMAEMGRDDAMSAAFFTALTGSEDGRVIGLAVFGVSAALPFDAVYRLHLEELAETISFAYAREFLRASNEKIKQHLILADRLASVGTLAAGAAHEINNPLTAITGNLEIALEELAAITSEKTSTAPLPSGRLRDLEDMIRRAYDGAERVQKIVSGLKSFSRAGQEARSAIALAPILELSITMAFHEIRERARVVKDYGPLPLVEAHEAQLGQLFINLLVNAAQSFPDGSVDSNEIHVITSTDAKGRAVVVVRDTGPGIPPHLIDRIFEPFFTTRDVGRGSGLGLSIAHNIVANIGGELTVESKEGEGATFRVVLPAAIHQSVREVVAVKPPTVAVAATGRRARVLVVDDEPPVGIILGRILREHDVTIVTCVPDALNAIESQPPFDVILSDLMMPGVSGMNFYDELLRRSPALAERLVFVTGGASTPAAIDFLARVQNERVEKPFDTKALRAIVQRYASANKKTKGSSTP
jgi:signal transduction histidine kinase/CheY-like chemotaxis protein